MGSLVDELHRREAAARAEAEELRGRIAELAERLAGVEERLSRLVITRETVEEVLGAAAEAPVSPVAAQRRRRRLPSLAARRYHLAQEHQRLYPAQPNSSARSVPKPSLQRAAPIGDPIS